MLFFMYLFPALNNFLIRQSLYGISIRIIPGQQFCVQVGFGNSKQTFFFLYYETIEYF